MNVYLGLTFHLPDFRYLEFSFYNKSVSVNYIQCKKTNAAESILQ